MRPAGSPESLEQRRRRAIELLRQGLMPVEVARRVGVDRRSVRRWNASYRKKGIVGIEAKPASGRPQKLSAQEKRRLERMLVRGAQKSGFHTDLWTCPRVARVIHERLGVAYHVDHIGRLLHGMGWTPQRPRRMALERDEQLIQNWVRTEWPRAKKKRTD